MIEGQWDDLFGHTQENTMRDNCSQGMACLKTLNPEP